MPKSKKPIIKNMPKRRRTKWRKKSRMHFSMSLCRYEGDGSDNIEMNMRIPSDDPVKAIRIIAASFCRTIGSMCVVAKLTPEQMAFLQATSGMNIAKCIGNDDVPF